MIDPVTTTANPTGRVSHPASVERLPKVTRLLSAQVRYQLRRLASNGRGIVVGLGLPVILLVAAKGNASHSHPNVAGYAIFGLTITAWSTYGVRLVAAREAGVLKRWWATPLPRWCYFAGSIAATAVVAVLAGAITVTAAVVFYGSHFDQGPSVNLSTMAGLAILVAFILGALAWAGAATTVTRAIPTVEAAFPVLILVYFPVIIVSGALFRISEPGWLSTLATYLPAQPLIDAVTRAVRHTAVAPFLPTHDVVVLACWAVGSLVAAVLLFRWEPHRPTQRRPARASHGGRS